MPAFAVGSNSQANTLDTRIECPFAEDATDICRCGRIPNKLLAQ